jgi:hypothetical protein
VRVAIDNACGRDIKKAAIKTAVNGETPITQKNFEDSIHNIIGAAIKPAMPILIPPTRTKSGTLASPSMKRRLAPARFDKLWDGGDATQTIGGASLKSPVVRHSNHWKWCLTPARRHTWTYGGME